MKILRTCLLLSLISAPLQAGEKPKHPTYDYRDGDIVLYSGSGNQAKAVKEATGSPYTHCGVVFLVKGKWWVFEAVHPVKGTPLEEFMGRDIDQYRALRLKKPMDPEAVADKVGNWIKEQIGKPYDVKFRWENEKLYCSELVWKLYSVAGIELCEKRAFKDYNLEAPAVARMIKQRYGGAKKLPLDEPVVAPSDIAASELLIEVPRLAKAGKS